MLKRRNVVLYFDNKFRDESRSQNLTKMFSLFYCIYVGLWVEINKSKRTDCDLRLYLFSRTHLQNQGIREVEC